MAMLVIRIQVYENYAWKEDGTIGTGAEAYWKAKGGHEYKILGVPLNVDFNAVVRAAKVDCDDDYFREYVIDWSIENDDYLSWFEQQQLKYDGGIDWPEPSTSYQKVMGLVAQVEEAA